MKNTGARSPAALSSGGFTFFVLILLMGLAGITHSQPSMGVPMPAPAPLLKPVIAPLRTGTIGVSTPANAVYHNSVIPGGVRHSSELASALARDHVARIHYANFDATKAHIVHLKAPQLVHVSYRMGNKIYWTKKKVRLATGEALLTDGKSFVRARCGNRIAEVPQSIVSDREPAPEVLDTVIPPARGAVNSTANSTYDTPPPAAPYSTSFNSPPTGAAQWPQFFSTGTPPPVALVPPPGGGAPAPTPVGGIDNVGAPVPGTVPPIGLPPEGLPTPVTVTPVPIPSPPTTQPPIPIPNGQEPILPTFPPPSSAFPIPPIVSPHDGTVTKVPEPGSFALVLLALFTLALIGQPSNKNSDN